jgi:hypothetical protein
MVRGMNVAQSVRQQRSSRAHSSSVRSCRSSTLRVVPAPAPKIRQTGPSLRRVPARDTDPFADLAAQYIEATLGVQVERWDRAGGQRAHDLRYEHRSRLVAVEVKCVLDEDYRQMQGEIDKKEYQPYERLSRLWDVRLGHGAQITSVRHELPDLLVLLDEIGWDSRLWQLQREFPGVAARLQALGVGGSYPFVRPRRIRLGTSCTMRGGGASARTTSTSRSASRVRI